MADTEYGVSISQEGVPVATAADFQKPLDTRFKYFEVESEFDFSVSLPPMATSDPLETTWVANHNLGFIPAFESNAKITAGDSAPYSGFAMVKILADKKSIFLQRTPGYYTTSAQVFGGAVRIYNLAILEDYQAPRDHAIPIAGTAGNIGFRALDGSVPNLGPSDQSSIGYSVDTKKKILAIHRTGLIEIGTWMYKQLEITNIDVATNIFTFINAAPKESSTDWVQTGVAVTYTTNNPHPTPEICNTGAPNYSRVISYIIKTSYSTFKLATSQANAFAGIEIDMLTAGYLSGTMYLSRTGVTDTSIIYHNVGYPPTYMLAPVVMNYPNMYVGQIMNQLLAVALVTNSTLQLRGIQASFAGRFGLIILKDPVEVAQ